MRAVPHVAWATQRAAALAGFFGAAATFGLGAAVIDSVVAGSTEYYVGWMVVALGVLMLLAVTSHAVFRPYSAFAFAFLFEVYGWWNVFWAIGNWHACRGCSFLPSVSLITLRGLFPDAPDGISLPFWLFAVTTFGAIVIPIGAASVSVRPSPKTRDFV